MTVAAPGPISAIAALVNLAALPLPEAGAGPARVARAPDQIVLSPPPTPEILHDLAVAGQHQLAALLPTFERLLQIDPAPLPLGHLARAVGDAAHWIDAGAPALLATNQPEAWRQSARAALHQTADLLTRAEHSLQASGWPAQAPQRTAEADHDIAWALTQTASAQRHVGEALATISAMRRAPIAVTSAPNLPAAAAVFGAVLLLLLLALAYGAGVIIAGLASVAVALVWAWRVVISSRRLRLELRR